VAATGLTTPGSIPGSATRHTVEQAVVLEWAREVRRDLPWRRTRDPWSILVAEVMLQQTGAERVVPKWRSFLDRWPDVRTCATSELSEVLEQWSGLGYPRRARNLWSSARMIVEHGAPTGDEVSDGRVPDGWFPDDLEGLLALPGVGPYTARAVLAFAFERDVAVVDTNVGRVLARRAGTRLRPREAQDAADHWVPEGAGWEWNQGLLDLGALRCRPTRPDCDACPVAMTCAWHLDGHPDPDPARRSAGVSRPQARFEGSARQARGRLLRAVQSGPVEDADLVQLLGWVDRPDADAAARAVADSLVADGLVSRAAGGRTIATAT